MILRPLTAELDNKESPVRRFLDERFTSGLRDVQRRYRQAAPPLVGAFGGPAGSQPGNRRDGGRLAAAVHAAPPAVPRARGQGAALCGRRSGVVEAFIEIAESLGYDPDAAARQERHRLHRAYRRQQH